MPRGMLLVHWGKPWTSFKHYSAYDVLSDAPDPQRAGRYKDKIVIVGITATGNADFGTTPLALNVPLSRIHSHALNTILTGNFISHVSPFPWIIVFSILLAILFPVMTSRLSLTIEALSAGLICLGAFVGATACFLLWSCDIPLIEAFFVFLPAACASVLIRGTSIEWEAAQTKRALERYLLPELLERSFSEGMDPDLSTRRRETDGGFRGHTALFHAVRVCRSRVRQPFLERFLSRNDTSSPKTSGKDPPIYRRRLLRGLRGPHTTRKPHGGSIHGCSGHAKGDGRTECSMGNFRDSRICRGT